MDAKTFDSLVSSRLESIRQTLSSKADEYARGDRLSNFKQIASMLHVTHEHALLGLVAKHWIALCDFVSDLDKGVLQSESCWHEKLGDIIAYMILLEALVSERGDSYYGQHEDPQAPPGPGSVGDAGNGAGSR